MISVKQVSKIYKVKQQVDTKNILKALLKCEYKQVKAVESISFNIKQGEMVGLIGLNGADRKSVV